VTVNASSNVRTLRRPAGGAPSAGSAPIGSLKFAGRACGFPVPSSIFQVSAPAFASITRRQGVELFISLSAAVRP